MTPDFPRCRTGSERCDDAAVDLPESVAATTGRVVSKSAGGEYAPSPICRTESMADDRVPEDELLEAGGFSAWLAGMRAALRGERESDVPCGTCTACCTSSQFVYIEPDETDTLVVSHE